MGETFWNTFVVQVPSLRTLSRLKLAICENTRTIFLNANEEVKNSISILDIPIHMESKMGKYKEL